MCDFIDKNSHLLRQITCGVTLLVIAMPDQKLTLEDAYSLSYGRRSRRRTGSRTTPHRLNAMERQLLEQARKRGYLKTNKMPRRALLNTYLNVCESLQVPWVALYPETERAADSLYILECRFFSEDGGRFASAIQATVGDTALKQRFDAEHFFRFIITATQCSVLVDTFSADSIEDAQSLRKKMRSLNA